DESVDKQLFKACVTAYDQFPYNAPKPNIFENLIDKKYKDKLDKYTNFVYAESIFPVPTQLADFLKNYKASDWQRIADDPLYQYAMSILINYRNNIMPTYRIQKNRIDSLQQRYMKLILEKNADHYLYPDANSTLRVAYGKVEGYEPRDGVEYKYYTTLKGIMEKENPNIYDYVVMPKLKELYKTKDYGQYGDKDGTMHVCFIASNHTTGGNSGSPVLNADGQLIGLNFDRNWEGTMSDLKYDPDQCRNITLDVRYCLFIIDKFAGADRLIKEMDLVN
ncbi:MAG: serine protease, partial [Bacteroidetes bacterium]